MRSKNYSREMIVLLSYLLMVINLQAQEQKTNNVYEPSVGQQGKDVVWVPTPQELVNKMLEIAKVTPSDFVIDLGSGDGRTVITAAKLGAKAMGVEYNPDMVLLSVENAKKEGVSNKTEFIKADLFDTDLSKATVITMFLLPEINLKLRPKILDLKPGTRIVSNTFTMGEWEADYEVTTEENGSSWNTAYLWVVPAKANGKWKLGTGELNLIQEFQFLHGTLSSGEKIFPVTDGRLNGEEITFTVSGKKYSGKVDIDTMIGTSVNPTEGNMTGWIATHLK